MISVGSTLFLMGAAWCAGIITGGAFMLRLIEWARKENLL